MFLKNNRAKKKKLTVKEMRDTIVVCDEKFVENSMKNDGLYYKLANDTEKQEFRDLIKTHLKMGEVVVEFLKKDGSVRKMTCTLKENLIPANLFSNKVEDTPKRAVPQESIAVVDLEKKEWRAFRYDSVRSVSFNPVG